jgi:hypothetical protein
VRRAESFRIFHEQHLSDQIKDDDVDWACETRGIDAKIFENLAGKVDWKRSFGRLKRRCEDIIKIDLK